MAATGGVSGTAVAVTTAGGILIYAGLRGVSPIQALRDISSGHPEPVTGTPTVLENQGGGDDTETPTSPATSVTSGKRSSVIAAAQSFSGDIYSQAKRKQNGYSDCSSFVDKALRTAGITPPGGAWATTANFRLSPEWKTIPASKAQPGDIAVRTGHMVLVTAAGGKAGIGQERTGVNVKTGSVASLMGSGAYVYRTYRGYPAAPAATKPATVQA